MSKREEDLFKRIEEELVKADKEVQKLVAKIPADKVAIYDNWLVASHHNEIKKLVKRLRKGATRHGPKKMHYEEDG